MSIIISGFSGDGFTYIPAITATAGATTSVSVQRNTSITSFNPFSLVQFGTTPYTYFVSSGTLPTGITINSSTGIVSGSPSVIQSAANVVFGVQDATNEVATTTSTVSFTVLPVSYTVQYLIVGGGGSGGVVVGGGGGGGAFVPGSTTITGGTNYPITVGAGGTSKVYVAPGNPAPTTGPTAVGNQGTASVAFGTTAPGGGAGQGGFGSNCNIPGLPALAGASGGGAAPSAPALAAGIATGSPG